MYGWLGCVGGVVVFLVICLAVLVCSDRTKDRTSEYALWFVLFVDAAAGRVHLREALAARLGQAVGHQAVEVHFEALSRPDVPADITIGFCIFICACSFVALYLFRDSKLD